MLTVNNLEVTYGGIRALRGASLHIGEGQMVALIGSNGAGKTTLLNAISGLVRPEAGSITFDGLDLGRLMPHQVARIGLLQVPEGRQILGPLSVEENLQLGSLAAGARAGNAKTDLERVWSLFPILAERRLQQAGSLSGGQQQMLAIARALMGRPRLLMLDEPSLGLAPVVVRQVFQVLSRLNREGLTIFLVEQNARRALEATQYCYVIEQGEIVQEGPSAALHHDPNVVASYLGQHAEALE